MRGHEGSGAGVGDHGSAELDPPVVGPQQAGDHQQQRGLAGSVGSEHGEYLAVVECDVELDAALLQSRLHADGAHSGPVSRRLGRGDHDHRGDDDEQQRQRDRGIGIGLALQVDLQRQRPGDALQRPGEGQRRPELAERAGERQHRARHQPGQHQRQRHGRAARWSGRAPRVAAMCSYAGPAERSAPSRLTTRNGSDTKDWASTTAVVENAIRMPEHVEVLAEQALPAEGVQQRDAADHRRQHQRQQHQGAQHRLAGESAAGQHQRHRHAEQHADARCWQSRSSGSKPVQHARIRR